MATVPTACEGIVVSRKHGSLPEFLKGGAFTVEHAESTLAAILAETNSVKGESSSKIERFAHEDNQLTTTPKCQR